MDFDRPVDLHELRDVPGLLPSWAGVLEEAGCVCLDGEGHGGAAELAIVGDDDIQMYLTYSHPDDLTVANHRDTNVATEHGACGVALLLCRLLKGHGLVSQALQEEGVDYWVGEAEEGRPFNKKARLEASGIRRGNRPDVDSRFSEKLKTTAKSGGTYDVVIAVVEFSQPLARVETKP